MKILTTFDSLTGLTTLGDSAGFPVTNITDLDPGKWWKSAAYAGDVYVMAQISKSVNAVFLNQCNFSDLYIDFQTNPANFNVPASALYHVTLIKDDAGNRKGWFDLSGFSGAGYVLFFIPASQTLDNGETLPRIGNIIMGTSATMPLVSDLSPRMTQRFNRFESDGGGITKVKKGRARHTINIGIGDSLANIRAMSKTWDIGVLYADMGNAGESWLVYPPDSWEKPIRSVIDSQLSFTVEERP